MTDRKIILIVTVAIAVLGLAGLAGIILLAVVEKPVPDVLQNITVGSLTALAALLVRQPTPEPPPGG